MPTPRRLVALRPGGSRERARPRASVSTPVQLSSCGREGRCPAVRWSSPGWWERSRTAGSRSRRLCGAPHDRRNAQHMSHVADSDRLARMLIPDHRAEMVRSPAQHSARLDDPGLESDEGQHPQELARIADFVASVNNESRVGRASRSIRVLCLARTTSYTRCVSCRLDAFCRAELHYRTRLEKCPRRFGGGRLPRTTKGSRPPTRGTSDDGLRGVPRKLCFPRGSVGPSEGALAKESTERCWCRNALPRPRR
jgi:hypothetical protein